MSNSSHFFCAVAHKRHVLRDKQQTASKQENEVASIILPRLTDKMKKISQISEPSRLQDLGNSVRVQIKKK